MLKSMSPRVSPMGTSIIPVLLISPAMNTLVPCYFNTNTIKPATAIKILVHWQVFPRC